MRLLHLELFEAWDTIREVLAPGRIFAEAVSQERDSAEQQLLELSLMSSREEYWQVYVSLMAYEEETGNSAREVLGSVPFSMILGGHLPLDSNAWWEYKNSYLGFVADRFAVEPRAFIVAAHTIDRQVGAFLNSAEAFSAGTGILKECIEAYPVPPNTYGDLANCLRSGIASARHLAVAEVSI